VSPAPARSPGCSSSTVASHRGVERQARLEGGERGLRAPSWKNPSAALKTSRPAITAARRTREARAAERPRPRASTVPAPRTSPAPCATAALRCPASRWGRTFRAGLALRRSRDRPRRRHALLTRCFRRRSRQKRTFLRLGTWRSSFIRLSETRAPPTSPWPRDTRGECVQIDRGLWSFMCRAAGARRRSAQSRDCGTTCVGRDDEPGRVMGAATGQGLLVGLVVVAPELSLLCSPPR